MLTRWKHRFLLRKDFRLPLAPPFELQAALGSPAAHTAEVPPTTAKLLVSLPRHQLCSVAWQQQEDQGSLDINRLQNLAEQGEDLAEAVQALGTLADAGFHVAKPVLYNALKRCTTGGKYLALGRQVHAVAVRSGYQCDAFLANHFICMYTAHGRLDEAVQVFSKVPAPNRYMWASIILAHARHGRPRESIQLYRQMRRREGSGSGSGSAAAVRPDNHVFAAVLKACAAAEDLCAGRQVHAHILLMTGAAAAADHDVVVGACLVDMYSKCGGVEDARRVFNTLRAKDVVTWNAMIAGYAQHGLGEAALALFQIMHQAASGTPAPNYVTFVCLLQACASVGALRDGERIHALVRARGMDAHSVVVGNALVDMYAKCGSLGQAREVFDRLPSRNVVTWNSMMGAYVQHGLGQEALTLYEAMQQQQQEDGHGGGVQPNDVTYVCLLQACGMVARLDKGQAVHADIVRRGTGTGGGNNSSNNTNALTLVVSNALIDMYGKCGSMDRARQVFDSMPVRDTVTWNALMGGYARQGDGDTVFALFRDMRRSAAGGGVQPDSVTFLSVLAACSHAGLVQQGQAYFQVMCRDYGIPPGIEHYTCLVDLFGRVGQVDRAVKLVTSMPVQPDGVAWTSVLGACRKWNDVALGKRAFESAVKLDEKGPAAYVLMANIYEAAEMRGEAREVQERRLDVNARKPQGQSSYVDTEGSMHTFLSGGVSLDKER